MLYLVLQDKSWNPSPSEAIVCFSAWIGTFGLFIAGCVLIKISQIAYRASGQKSDLYRRDMVLILAVGLLSNGRDRLVAGNRRHLPTRLQSPNEW